MTGALVPQKEIEPRIGDKVPTDWATVDRILEKVASGLTTVEAVRDEGINRTTFYRWILKDPEVAEQYHLARILGADVMADEIKLIADNTELDLVVDPLTGEVYYVRQSVERAKVRIAARQWLMSKISPKRYGQRLELEHSGETGVGKTEYQVITGITHGPNSRRGDGQVIGVEEMLE